MVTRREQNVAMPVLANRRAWRAPRDVIKHIREARKEARLPKGYTLRRLVEEGRRF
jgi:hypothetical protein